jgi:5'-methylthioadenosine nucleosidase
MATIALVIAMRAEAAPLIEELGAIPQPVGSSVPTQAFIATFGDDTLVIGVNGVDPVHGVDLVGTEPAVLTTMQVIERWKPDVVISAGTAGGWSRSAAEIGDVYVAWPHVVRHDRRIGIERFHEYGIGSHPVWNRSEELALALGARTGIVTTGNSLDESETDREWILSLSGEVKEMEAAAVAWVCALSGTPFVAIKTITDLVDHPTPTADQFLANLNTASTRLSEILPKAIRWCTESVNSEGY